MRKSFYCQVDALTLLNFPKIPKQCHNSVSRGGHEVEDIFTAFTHMDENKLLERLPCFVSSSPDSMPSTRLVEGDIAVLLDKLSSLQDAIASVILANKVHSKITKKIR